MMVGQTGSGKSVAWRVLQAAMTRLKRDGEPGYNVVRVCSRRVLDCFPFIDLKWKWNFDHLAVVFQRCSFNFH